MRKLAFILLLMLCAGMLFASSNGGVRHLQPKRVPVILTNYADVTFKSTDYSAYKASLEQYFAENSFGQYTPTFDFIGPVKLDGNRSNYGANDEDGDDVAAEEMVAQACNQAENLADFTQYDQDGDGRLDAVVIIYAGEGERMDNNLPDAVWEFTDDLETTYALDYLVQLDGRDSGIAVFLKTVRKHLQQSFSCYRVGIDIYLPKLAIRSDIVHSPHVVIVCMGNKYAVNLAEGHLHYLLSEIRSAVYQQSCVLIFYKRRAT